LVLAISGTSKLLVGVVLIVALAMAFGHAPLALFLGPLMRPEASRPPPNATGSRPSASGGAQFPFFLIGAYFLISTILFIVGGILVAAGKLFNLANIELIVLSIIDNVLLIYTRTMPNIFFGTRSLHWSWGWYPLGTVQILVGQTILIILCAALLFKRNSSNNGKTGSV
jgi:hypothetical protein